MSVLQLGDTTANTGYLLVFKPEHFSDMIGSAASTKMLQTVDGLNSATHIFLLQLQDGTISWSKEHVLRDKYLPLDLPTHSSH
jgi:hypothetical protein